MSFVVVAGKVRDGAHRTERALPSVPRNTRRMSLLRRKAARVGITTSLASSTSWGLCFRRSDNFRALGLSELSGRSQPPGDERSQLPEVIRRGGVSRTLPFGLEHLHHERKLQPHEPVAELLERAGEVPRFGDNYPALGHSL